MDHRHIYDSGAVVRVLGSRRGRTALLSAMQVRMVGNVRVQREVQGGYVWSAIPVVVAQERGLLALNRPGGTVCLWPSHPRGEHKSFEDVTQRAEPWAVDRFAGLLTLVRPGDDFSVSLMWEADWSFLCWYIDFIRPYERTPIGWDFADIHLDLIVTADGKARTKDEDELATALARGEVSLLEADAAYRRRDELASMAERGDGVFGAAWPDWRPQDNWPFPALSERAVAKLQQSATPAGFELNRRWWITDDRRGRRNHEDR